jgi:prolyl 4-hydroxylase
MASSAFRLPVEYLIPLAFILLLAGGPVQKFLLGGQNDGQPLSSHEVPILDAEKLVFPEKDLFCPQHSFGTHILSTEPLVVYISGFLSEQEADHLVQIR